MIPPPASPAYKEGNTSAQGFKEFILRGNVVDLAVGIVIGASFSTLINSFIASFLTPLVALLTGQRDLSEMSFVINGVIFELGTFLNSFISFIIIALVLYYFVILPMNRLNQLAKFGKPTDPTEKKCSYCFTDIPINATRCPHCTSELKDSKK